MIQHLGRGHRRRRLTRGHRRAAAGALSLALMLGGGTAAHAGSAPATTAVTTAARTAVTTAASTSSGSSSGATAGTTSPSGATNGQTVPSPHHSPLPRILGLAALFLALLLYSEGYGVLGGRIRSINSRGAQSRR